MPHSPSAADARASLALVDGVHADLADRLLTPRWYHVAIGLVEALVVIALTLPLGWQLATSGAAVVVAAVLVVAWTRGSGLGMSGRYTVLAWEWVAALAAVVVVAIAVVVLVDRPAATVVCAVAVFVATVVAGRCGDHALRTRLRAGNKAG